MTIIHRNDTATLVGKFCRYSPLVYEVDTIWKQILFLCAVIRYAFIWHDFDVNVQEFK